MIAHHELRVNFETLRETETRLLHREEEIEKILVGMTSGVHTFIYGSIGTGKTTAVKRAIERFNDARNKALHISCLTCKTVHAVLKELISQINANLVSAHIVIEIRSNYDILQQLKAALKKFERTSFKVVALDHFQALEETGIVDNLIEMGFTVILVSDDAKAVGRLSPSAQSYFANTIHFEDYTQEQLVKIFHSKARHLIGEGLYTEPLIAEIAKLSNGNIMYGETLLLAAALEAVRARKECVDETDVPELLPSGETISQDERAILEVLKEMKAVQGGELYKKYCERVKFPKAERTFRNYMQSLCQKNLVKAVGTNKGRVYEIVQ